jgi:quercetin dioxygenase-like cupin family protein
MPDTQILERLHSNSRMFDNVSLRLDALQHLFRGDRSVELQPTETGFYLNKDVSLTTVFQTEDTTVSLAVFTHKGVHFGFHKHNLNVEYVIVTRGSFMINIAGTCRLMKRGECAAFPKGVVHSGESMEDDTQVLAICVPPEPAYVIGS